MKRLLFTFFAIMLLGTSWVWGSGTTTTLARGKYKLVVTTTQISNDLEWTSSYKTSFKLSDDISYSGFGVNAAMYNQTGGGKGLRYYESQNYLGASKISVPSGYWMDSICVKYNINRSGVLSSTKDTAATGAPIPTNKRYNSGTPYAVNAASFTFYSGRTNASSSNGTCDITDWTIVYSKLPTSTTMPTTKTISVGNAFQIGLVAPLDAYQVWSTTDASKVAVDQYGVITAKAAGSATIKVKFADNTEKSCVVTVVADNDKNFTENYSKLTATSGSYNTSQVIYTADNGIKWQFRHYKYENASKIEGNPGVDMNCKGQTSYIAYYSDTKGCTGQEGGVKRVSFQWKAVDPTKPLRFEIDDSNNSNATVQVMSLPANATSGTQFYSYDLNDTGVTGKDVALRVRNIKNASNSSVIVGPVTITPYLLYTTKVAEATGSYKNESLINNTGETPTFTLEDNDGEASINPSTGEVTCLKEGQVTVKASWGNVSTTYTLTTHVKPIPEADFTQKTVDKDLLDSAFINPFTKQEGSGDVSYESSRPDIATVESDGTVTIIKNGTTIITANVAENGSFAATSKSYTLNVGYTPVEGKFWAETFSKCPNEGGTGKSAKADVSGDSAVYNWYFTYFQRRATGNDDKNNGVQGVRVRYGGSIANKGGKLEGGIKAVSFDWRTTSGSNPVDFKVNVDGVSYQYQSTAVASDIVNSYARKFDVTKNTDFSISLDSANQAFIVVSSLKFVPYLLFTTKTANVDCRTVKNYNLKNILINNTGEEPSYSVTSGTTGCQGNVEDGVLDLSDVNATGDINVTATWGSVTTTMKITVTNAYAEVTGVTLNESILDLSVGNRFQIIGTVAPETANPALTWSSNNACVEVDQNGVINVKGEGEATITATAVNSMSASCKITAAVKNYTSITDTIKAAVTTDKNYHGMSSAEGHAGDNGVFQWIMRGYRRTISQGDSTSDGAQATRLCYNDTEGNVGKNYIAYNNEYPMEGGVKRISFDWKAANGVYPVAFNVDNTGQPDGIWTRYETLLPAADANKSWSTYTRDVNMAKNVQLRITIPRANGAVITVSPLTITPYLLYTKKTETIDAVDYVGKQTYINTDIIDNTGEGEITYSITSSNPENIAEIEDANKHNGKVTIKGGGTITVQAKWEGVTTTYTLVINKAEYTPAFAETTVPKTMNDSAFTIALNNVLSTGARTYSSTNERVATVNDTGLVAIQGPGTAKIKVEIAADGIYKKANAEYTLNVTEPTTETYVTEGFTGLTWGLTTPDPLNGDLGVWTTYYTRRQDEKDSIMSKGKKVGAEWMSGSEQGYLVSNAAIEGGVKRIYMTWVKTAPTQDQESKFLVQVGEVKDTFDCKEITNGTYLHNFNIRENSVIKVANASTNNFRAGPIVITPYIYYIKRAETIMASEYVYPKTYSQEVLNNTNGVGTITYESDNTDVAEALPNGNVKIKAAAADPVTITAKWQPDPNVEKYVTTSFKLYITDKKQREAEFDLPSVTVTRGATPVNALDLQSPKGDSEPVVVYESSDTEVAVIGDGNAVLTVGPGTATITAHIGETNKCLAQDVSYALTVTYAPADGTYFTETFSQAVASGYKQGPDTITGTNGVYEWELKRYRRSTSDMVGKQQGIRICYDEKKSNAYLATVGAQEGGVKEVVFDYSVPGNADNVIHFYVQAGDSIHNFHHAPITTGGVAFPYAHDFSQKSNVKFSIMMDTLETPAQAAINVAPVKVIPYLLYTRKDTTVYAKDCENFEFINDSLIDNTNSEGTITYSVPDDNGVASIDATGKITILGEGDVTVTATWKPSSESEDVVTTTYQLHIVLEATSLTFAEGEVVKQLKSDPEQDWYQQQATLSPEAVGTFTYSIVDDPEGASIDPSNGIVTYTAPGTYVIKATFAQQLPYKASEATYSLIVNSLPTPTIAFDNVEKTMNAAPFINPMKETLTGLGKAHYASNDKAVATVVDSTGLVTIQGPGTATISVHFDEGTAYAEGDGSYTLTVTDPNDAAVIETYPGLPAAYAYEVKTLDGKVTSWDYLKVRHANSDVMADNSYATRYGNAPDAYVVTKDDFEGGIKRVSFKWNKASPDVRTVSFRVSAGEEAKDSLTQTVGVKGQTLLSTDVPYNHNFLVKKNAKLQICSKSDGTGNGCYLLVGAVKITPYLRFKGAKEVDVDLDNVVTEFNLNDTIINNTEGGTINFAVDSFKTDVEPTISNGVVNFDGITKGGKVYVSAKWEDVVTTLVINTTIKPEVNFAVPAPAAQDLISGSYTNVLSTPEGVGAVTYTSSNKQVATVDNDGKVTFLVAGTTKITAKVAASTIYNKTEKSYDLTINGYTPSGGEAWVETFSLMQQQNPYATTEQAIAGDSSVYSWKANDYIRPDVKKPFRLHTNGYIKTNGNQEGGIKYVALNWIAAATGNIDFTMKVNNDSYQFKDGVTVNKAYRFEHFFNADSVCPLEIKIGSKDITAYMSVVDVTVVPYLLYTEKTATIKIGETYTNTNLINNLEDKTAVKYTIVEGGEYATINGDELTGVKAGTVKVKAYLNDKLYTTYQLTITTESEITLDEKADNSEIINSYAGVENMTVNLTRTLATGKYNTFCLPFDIEKDDLAAALTEKLGEDVQITSLATLDASQPATLVDQKNLNIVITEVDEMEAGKPYLLAIDKAVTNPSFTNVTISADNEGIASLDNTVTFYGITSPKKIGKDEKSVLFLSNDKLSWNATGKDSKMNGLRAYFEVPGMTSTSGVAPRLVLRQPQTPTGVVNHNDNDNHNCKMIINNQLVIIRDGKMYNAQGAEL